MSADTVRFSTAAESATTALPAAPAFMVDTANGGVRAEFEGNGPPPAAPAAAERPAWLPAKFKTAEEMAASYAALEAKQSGKPAEPVPAVVPPVTPPAAVTPEAAKAEAEKAGVDWTALTKEFQDTGALSEATLKGLEAKGIPREKSQGYVDGIKAQGAAIRNEFAQAVGGEEQLAALMEWSKANLSPVEAKAYNDLLDSGNTAAAKMLMQGINARYVAAVGSPDPARVVAAAVSGPTGVQPFQSTAQVREAMSDKRYATDPAYRKTVEERLSVSENLF